jgi:RNA polymerase sigma-70 factor (ECF subfamily)
VPDACEGASQSAGWVAGLSVVPNTGADGNPESTERDLVGRARAGDLDAQARLFDEHYMRVYTYLRTRVHEQADAEDLAQEVFIRMLDALPRFSYRGVPFRAWLIQIAANLVNDFYRKRGTAAKVWSLQDDDFEDRAEGDPAAWVELQVSLAEVGEAMQHLTELEREVIRLRYAAELSIAETAAVTGKSENNVKQLAFKGLNKLRKVLGPRDAGDS